MSSASLRSQTVHIRALARSLQSRPHYRTATTSSKETQSPPPPPPRRAVTVTTDTGRIPWSELSYRERGARTTQQAVNFGVLVLAMTMTAGVVYVMYTEVFSTESKTAVFNRCADRVRKDARCIELLAGPGKHSDDIVAHHHREAGSRTWRRLVDIAYVLVHPKTGRLLMPSSKFPHRDRSYRHHHHAYALFPHRAACNGDSAGEDDEEKRRELFPVPQPCCRCSWPRQDLVGECRPGEVGQEEPGQDVRRQVVVDCSLYLHQEKLSTNTYPDGCLRVPGNACRTNISRHHLDTTNLKDTRAAWPSFNSRRARHCTFTIASLHIA